VSSGNEKAPANRRILHINHPAAILRLVEKLCLSKKFSVDSFESAAPGLHHALARKYHLLVLGLPTRGLDAARLLKGLVRAKVSTPVLIMAETRSKEKAELEKFPNVIGFISKPLDANEFSRYLGNATKPPELEPQEKEKLIAVLRKWESKTPNAN
jgi:DNA-binding NtrC family response regulator